jgi:predicted DNA-binding protein YlxM (UPF0122 family)
MTPEDELILKEKKEAIEWALSTLSRSQREVVEIYFGFFSIPMHTGKIAARNDVTIQAVHRLLKKAIVKLRRFHVKMRLLQSGWDADVGMATSDLVLRDVAIYRKTMIMKVLAERAEMATETPRMRREEFWREFWRHH